MSKRLLSIAADAALRTSRQLILEQAGFEVTSAADKEEALAACLNGSFSLLVIGQTEIEGDSERLAKLLRKKCPGVPILELHSHGTPHLPKADFSVETLDGPEALVLTVQRILEKAAPTSEKLRPKTQTA